MVEISDIKDRTSLEAWLRDQPRAVVVWIAFRAAARVLPIWWQAVLAQEWALKNELSALPPLRNLLISQVATVTPTDDIRISAAAAAEIGVIGVAFNAAVEADGAARGAISAVAAKDTVFRAASLAAFKSTRAVSGADATVWQAIKTDAAEAVGGPIPIGMSLWPANARPLEDQWSEIKTQVAASPDAADWQFWIDWYETLLKGRTMVPDPVISWEMLEQIALIDPETWDAGPEVVNPRIRKIWEGYKDGSSSAGHAADPEPVSDYAKSAMKQRVAVNRDALVVASAGIIDELGAYREQVRGMNHLEPDLRDEILAFIDDFNGKLSQLIQGLPASGSTIDDEQAGRLVLWLREYRGLLRHELAYYGSAKNVMGATVPTGIILGATGIGAMLGMPVAGSVVGGLIVNQMKPGQAARELTKPSGKETDLP